MQQNVETERSRSSSELLESTPRAQASPRGLPARIGRGVRSLGPFALALTAYGLVLDHLQDGWFKYDVLKYSFAGACALIAGLVVRVAVDVAAGRDKPVPVPAPTAGSSAESLFNAARAQVVKDLRWDQATGVDLVGWSQYLGDDVPPSAIGTSYGLRIVLALDVDGAEVNKAEIVQSLLRQQKPDGGWAASTQRDRARPEVTAWVLEAIVRAGVDEPTRVQLARMLENLVDPDDVKGMRRTTVIATLVSCFCEIAPASPLLRQLVRTLANGAVNSAGVPASWGQDLSEGSTGSVPHTAIAVCALERASLVLGEQDDLRRLLDSATTWLCREDIDLHLVDEQIRRPLVGGKVDLLLFGHFTAAWVARALMYRRAEDAVVEKRLEVLLTEVLRLQENGIWTWSDGRKPLWMTYQGLLVVRQHALRRAMPVP
jgi:hypothetical protein